MSYLIDYYNQTKQASAEASEAELEKQAQAEYVIKLASMADEMLAEEYGDDYTAEDVEELSVKLAEYDAELSEQMEKEAAEQVDELRAMGHIIAQGIKEGLEN